MDRPEIYRLPLETLWAIIREIGDTVDLKPLLLVSKRISEAAIPILYQTVILSQKEFHLCDLRIHRAFLDSVRRHPHWVQAFVLEAPFHRNCTERCPHSAEPHEARIDNRPTQIDRLGEDLVNFFQPLRDNSLRDFSWNLGICIPSSLLAENGYLPNRQQYLEQLSLITDPRCRSGPLHLSRFKSLQSISWVGLRSVRDSEALRDCFRGNAHQLKSLTIDLGDWNEADYSWYRYNGRGPNNFRNFFVEDILEIHPGEGSTLFQVLRRLSLCSVSFRSGTPGLIPETINVLNFHGLQTLKLWNCADMFVLLEKIADSVNRVMRLTHLELVADHLDLTTTFAKCHGSLGRFLTSFQGLTDLYLLCPAPIEDIFDGINHHRSTLERLVVHERVCDCDENSPMFEHPCDNQIGWSHKVTSVFRNPDLEFLGVSTWPSALRSALAAISPRPKYKVLHARSSRFNNENLPDFSGYSDGEMEIIRQEAEEAADGINALQQGPSDGSYDDFEEEADYDERSESSADAEGSENDETKAVQEPHFADDFRDLAQWAFGPKGLPELQLLAYGDFSHKGRYHKYTMLLCRNESPDVDAFMEGSSSGLFGPTYYRSLGPDDLCLYELCCIHEKSLAACNVSNVIVERDGLL